MILAFDHTNHPGISNKRSSRGETDTILLDEHHLIEHNLVTRGSCQTVVSDRGAGRRSQATPPGLDNCVHVLSPR